MSSLFDSYFSSSAPYLMSYLGTAASVTIISGETTILLNGDAIIRHVTAADEFDAQDLEMKLLKMEVDVLVDDSLSYGGLADDYTNAVAIVDGIRWSIEEVGNKTNTWQRLKLIRKEPRAARRSGFYRGS